MPTTLINPFNESQHDARQPAPKLATLAGKTIGLLDISKPGGNLFLDHLEGLLKNRFAVKEVVRITKPTFTKPAPAAVIEHLRQTRCDGVIEALAD